MKFSSSKEMYEVIVDGADLYNADEGIYVFVYNDAGALCYYSLRQEEADELARKANDSGEYWGAFLGWGGNILDNMDYDKFRYSDNEDERELYLKPSFDFCEECFALDGWAKTSEMK